MSIKLSEKQQHVIDLMNEGWELGASSCTGCWLQQGGLGHGGQSERVSRATIHALEKRKLINYHYGFPTIRYALIKEG